jgi:hypothetical protein
MLRKTEYRYTFVTKRLPLFGFCAYLASVPTNYEPDAMAEVHAQQAQLGDCVNLPGDWLTELV